MRLSWLWTSEAVYPFLYSQQRNSWIYYYRGTTAPRWFLDIVDPSNPFTDENIGDDTPTPPATRVTNGLIAYYPFSEGTGDPADQSGYGSPLNLTLSGGAQWLDGPAGITFNGGAAKAQSSTDAAKISDRILTTGTMTVEAWVKPALLNQSGPARIVSASQDINSRNFTLGYGSDNDDTLALRLRTSTTSENGTPATEAADAGSTNIEHYVATFDGITVRLYRNGTEAASAQPGGSLSWSSFPLVIGNEGSADRGFAGEIYLVAIYDRALKAEEIEQNFSAGSRPGADVNPPSAPTNLRATAISGPAIKIEWDAATDDVAVAGYDVYRADQFIATASGTSYIDTAVDSGVTYSYKVYAFDEANNLSPASNSDQATALDEDPISDNVVFTNSVSRTSAGITFTWTFNCAGKACATGQFVTGDYWVVPVDPDGVFTGAVTITGITPAGESHGAQVNPDLAHGNKQGLLNMYDSYASSLNIMTQLPYDALPGTSIAKIRSQTSGCGTKAISAGCVSTGNVLTILGAVPPDGGATVFRPPFHGSWKPLFSTNNVRFDRLSRISALGSGSSPLGGSDGYEHWTVPQYDINHTGFSQEFYRATSPHLVMHDYSANQAQQMLQDIMSTFGTHSNANKAMAVYTIMQKGIDNYGIFKMGIPFRSGAGQHLGKAPPVAYFAALYDDTAILNEIRAIAHDEDYIGFFQEYTQIRASLESGQPVWGDNHSATQWDKDRFYWHGHFQEYEARVRGDSGYDNNGAYMDAHRYIDGPGGGPLPLDSRGRNYQPAASAGPLVGYGFAQMLMPWLAYAAGYPENIQYADRYYKGRNISGFNGGFWARPDPCAPIDSREHVDCSPYHGGTSCTYYRVTWGPDPNNPGDCIKHGGDPNTMGRWSVFLSMANPEPEHPLTAHGAWPHEPYRLPGQVSSHWNTLRDCLDPEHPTYRTGTCSGLGPSPDL